MNVTTDKPKPYPRSVAAEIYEAAIEADPSLEDLPWDLLEPAKQAPWKAAANRAERLFAEGRLPTLPDPAGDPADLARQLAVYLEAATTACARLLPDGPDRAQVRTKLAEAGFWACEALGLA